MKFLLKKFTPKPLLKLYHYLLAEIAVLYYRHPSRRLIVIGVTGTKGKSTTSYLTAKMLEAAGFKVGLSSTIMFKVADKEWLNDKKMTMIGRFGLQKLLRQMVSAGCQYAVVETSSEGIAQYRHLGIDYDILVFTGLTPEHIESHGSFEKYKDAKLKIFRDLEKREIKKLPFGLELMAERRNKEIKKVVVVNSESRYAEEFLNFNVDEKINYQLSITCPESHRGINYQNKEYKVSEVNANSEGISFKVNDTQFNLKLLGQFNILNSLSAISVGLSQNIDLEKIKNALEKIGSIPGRMEIVYDKDFKVIVDYAHEPNSMEQVFKTVRLGFETQQPQKQGRIIAVFGGTGGGRDKSRRPKMGVLAAKYADIIILTTDDPYDENPEEIINDIEEGIKNMTNEHIVNEYIKVIDRKQAIKKAISLAEKNDIILILGKGSEQKMALADGKYIDWDDREIVKKILACSP